MEGILILTGTALVLSIILVLVNTLINKEDKRVEELEHLLPGVNCGGCGFGSCKGMACELIKNKASIDKCRVLRNEKREKMDEYLKNMK